MPFADISWLAVLVAFVAAFLLNFLYFNGRTMYPVWVRALGRDAQEEWTGPPMLVTFGLTALALLVQAIVLAALLALMRSAGEDIGLWAGLAVGALMGVAFAAAPALGHRLFSGQGLKVWVIESGADILGLALMGAVLGAWA